MRRFRMSAFFFILLLSTVAISVRVRATEPQPINAQCPTAEEFSPDVRRALLASDPKFYPNARISIGVDALGRVAAGIDSDRDGIVNEFLLFTEQTRLPGAWSTLVDDAVVFLTQGTARIEARDRSLGVVLAVDGASVPQLGGKKRFAKTLIQLAGIELVRVPAVNAPLSLRDLDYNNIQTWPGTFQQDLRAPARAPPLCEAADCDTGGCGATTCMIGSTSTVPGCSVGCSSNRFACCTARLLGSPRCRCYPYGPPLPN